MLFFKDAYTRSTEIFSQDGDAIGFWKRGGQSPHLVQLPTLAEIDAIERAKLTQTEKELK